MSAQEDAVVEAVARAICRANCGPVMRAKEPERVECQVENGWDMWTDEARAAISVVIEECAKVCDRRRMQHEDDRQRITSTPGHDQRVIDAIIAVEDEAQEVADAIRSLKSPPTGEK